MVAFGNHAAIIAPCAMMAAKISSGVNLAIPKVPGPEVMTTQKISDSTSPTSLLMQMDCCWISLGQTASP